jgi:hypothetical protein
VPKNEQFKNAILIRNKAKFDALRIADLVTSMKSKEGADNNISKEQGRMEDLGNWAVVVVGLRRPEQGHNCCPPMPSLHLRCPTDGWSRMPYVSFFPCARYI